LKSFSKIKRLSTQQIVGRDSSICLTTRYGLDGPVIESRLGRDYLHLSILALGSTQPPIQWVPDLSVGKTTWAWTWPPI